MPITLETAKAALNKFVCAFSSSMPKPSAMMSIETLITSEGEEFLSIYDKDLFAEYVERNRLSYRPMQCPHTRRELNLFSRQEAGKLFGLIMAILYRKRDLLEAIIKDDETEEELREFYKSPDTKLLAEANSILDALIAMPGKSVNEKLGALADNLKIYGVKLSAAMIKLFTHTLSFDMVDIKEFEEARHQQEAKIRAARKAGELPVRLPLAAIPLMPISAETLARIGYGGRFSKESEILSNAAASEILEYHQEGVLHKIYAEQGRGSDHHRLRSRSIRISGSYQSTLALPQVPVIHPYHPTGAEQRNARRDGGVARFSLTIELPQGTISNLPPGTVDYLVENKIRMEAVQTFIVFQNKPWQDAPLELRPHPWLHKAAPEKGRYSCATQIHVALADVDSRFAPLTEVGVTTHGEGSDVIFSPDNMHIQGLSDHTVTEAFYSFCLNKSTRQVAITLHCLLSDDHQRQLEAIVSEGGRIPKTIADVHLQLMLLGNKEWSESITTTLGEFIYGRNIHAVAKPAPQHTLADAPRASASSSISDVAVRPSAAVPVATPPPIPPTVTPAPVLFMVASPAPAAAPQAASSALPTSSSSATSLPVGARTQAPVQAAAVVSLPAGLQQASPPVVQAASNASSAASSSAVSSSGSAQAQASSAAQAAPSISSSAGLQQASPPVAQVVPAQASTPPLSALEAAIAAAQAARARRRR